MRRKLIAGNWKMHGNLAQNLAFAQALQQVELPRCDLLICPPFPYLQQMLDLLAPLGIQVGAQDCAQNAAGAYTGEVAASMLADLGVTHVLLGHSERRQYQQESNEQLLLKLQQALAAGLQPIVCVGETLAEREADETETVILSQVTALSEQLQPQQLAQVIWAYEPVWAIGTGLTATPLQAQAVHQLIRNSLCEQLGDQAEQVLLLYGGSVKADNAASLFSMPDIDGGLVGGASLDASQFLAIGQAAEK